MTDLGAPDRGAPDGGAPAAVPPIPADDDAARAEAPPPTPGAASVAPDEEPPATPRPVIERIGLALIALVLALMFGGVSAASWAGGEPFLAVMGGLGCLMTIWVGVITLLRG